MDKKELEDSLKPENFANAMIKIQTDFIKSFSKDLAEDENSEPLARLPEDVFVNVFLPFFAGEENIYKVGLGNWETIASNGINGARGLYREVIIVDSNNEEIFRVPPIYDRTALKPIKISDTIALQSLFEKSQLLSMIKPSLGVKNNSNIFNALLSRMRVSETNSIEYLKRWNAIFLKYNRAGFLEDKNNLEDQLSESDNNASSYEIEDL